MSLTVSEAKMVEPKLRYTVRKRGKLFWQPTTEMRALGFRPKSLGADSDAARAEARRLAAAWDDAKAGRGRLARYPLGSFGAFYDGLRGSKDDPSAWWTKKSPRTRLEYEQAWQHIDTWSSPDGRPLSHLWPEKIGAEVVAAFTAHLEASVSMREAERTLKSLRALLNVAGARLGLKPPPKPARARLDMVYFVEAEGLDLVKIGAGEGFDAGSRSFRPAVQLR